MISDLENELLKYYGFDLMLLKEPEMFHNTHFLIFLNFKGFLKHIEIYANPKFDNIDGIIKIMGAIEIDN